MKIAIIGNPGSGKSTLAAKLHAITGTPVYHLDQYFWKPGWQRPDREEFAKIHHALCDKDDGLPHDLSTIALAKVEALRKGWIIEGMVTRYFDYRAEKADVIIFWISHYGYAYIAYSKELSPVMAPFVIQAHEVVRNACLIVNF